ncbi:MAG: GatB/YqeY domain-containing protein [Gemmatimonadetes bacterium]|nr:GatB/YqeY domain-containing protein [Gemmatimonadota bacterium]
MSDNELARRLAEDQKAALKAGDKIRVATLRLVSSELTNKRIELGRDPEEDEIIAILSKGQKQRREAEEQYREAGREELADKEAAEAVIIGEYLPEPLDDASLAQLIDAAISETGAETLRDMGAVMGRLMPEVRGRVDGSVVSARVKERLG